MILRLVGVWVSRRKKTLETTRCRDSGIEFGMIRKDGYPLQRLIFGVMHIWA